MRNFVHRGNVLTLTAPATLASGAGFLVGSIFAVATADAASGAAVEGAVTGVYDLPKTSAQAWSPGAAVYWDTSPGECTTVAEDNVLIGVAAAGAANPSAVGRVRLNGSFGHPVVNES